MTDHYREFREPPPEDYQPKLSELMEADYALEEVERTLDLNADNRQLKQVRSKFTTLSGVNR